MIRAVPSIRTIALALVCALTPAAASAQQTPVARKGVALSFVLEGVVEMGGDRFGETVFEDGSRQTMRAGQGGTGAIGLELRPSVTSPLSLRTTAGFKFVTTAADNADITLTRVPLEALASWNFNPDWRVGAGVSHHARIRFSGDDFADDVAFDPATGFTLELGWRWLSLTWTRIDYTDEFGNAYDASSIGVSLSWARRMSR
jgi:hypothetical protein